MQRTRNPLGPALAAKLRVVVADALRCSYAKERATSDLAAAGVSADDVAKLGDAALDDDPDRAALAFAGHLTADAAARRARSTSCGTWRGATT